MLVLLSYVCRNILIRITNNNIAIILLLHVCGVLQYSIYYIFNQGDISFMFKSFTVANVTRIQCCCSR